MRDKQIIIFEGICGSGKTTTAKQLHKYLQESGVNSRVYEEWEKSHPVNLAMHACITETELNSLCEEYPLHSERLKQKAVYEYSYVFIQYREIYNEIETRYFDGGLFEKLAEKDFCFGTKNIVPFDEYTNILKNKWKKFADDFMTNEVEIIIFESVLFQHQIHDLHRLYNMDNDGIINHISILAEQFKMFNPVIIYLTQANLDENLKRIAAERNKPRFYERINVYKKRKQIEYEAMSRLKLKNYVIDNSDYDYSKVFKIIKMIIDIK